MRAAVGTVVHIAGEHLAGLIGVRTFYYEDQFVAAPQQRFQPQPEQPTGAFGLPLPAALPSSTRGICRET